MLRFISSLCSAHAKATISWFDVTLINQSGSKVYNGIGSKMLTGSGNTVLQSWPGRVYNDGWCTIMDLRRSGPGGPPIPDP